MVNKIGVEKLLPPRQEATCIPVIGNDVFFSAFYTQIGDVGTKEFMENRLPFLMRYNTVDQKFYPSKLNSFPYIEEGIYYPTSYKVLYPSISGNNLPLVRYNYSSDIFEWDYKKDKLITHSFKSRLVDTIKPMASPSNYHFNNLECWYAHTYYDSFREIYFSALYFSEDFYDRGNGLWSIVIANKDFEYLGELYCNKKWPCDYTKEHTLNIYPINDSTIQIDYLELVKTDRDFDKYIDSCKNDLRLRREKIENIKKYFGNENNPVIEYLKTQKTILEKDYTALTVYIDSGCVGCNDFMLSLISENRSMMEVAPFYLIISGNEVNINAAIKKYNLEDFKNLITDPDEIIKKRTVFNGILNPRLTIVKNGEVKDDAIYDSFETETVLLPAFLGSLSMGMGMCAVE